jgi:hypothetical protein
MTITEFLLARIAEDKDRASLVLIAEVDQSSGVPEIRHRAIQERVLAECEAKRQIVEQSAQAERLVMANAEAYSAAMRSTPLDQEKIAALKTHGWELAGRRDGLRFAIGEIASAYSDHPDFRDEWRV